MKKVLLTTLQVVVTVFALWWVFSSQKTRDGISHAFQGGNNYWWLLAAALMAAVAPVCATVRLWLLLRVQDIVLPLRRVTQLYMIGLFFNLFLPGSTGGDAVKFFYLLRETPDPGKRVGAFLAVVMDRLLGFVALAILSISFVVARYSWLTQIPDTVKWVNGFLVILGSGAVGIVVTIVTAQFNATRFLPAKMPGRKAILELTTAIQSNTRAWRTSLGCILISFVGHMSVFVVFYYVALMIRAAVSFWDMTVAMPIVNTYAALPVSLSGMGVRETLTTSLLGGLCHLPAGVPVVISLVGFLCSNVLYGLVGGLFYLFYKGKAGAVPSDVEAINERAEDAALPAMIAEVEQSHSAPDAR